MENLRVNTIFYSIVFSSQSKYSAFQVFHCHLSDIFALNNVSMLIFNCHSHFLCITHYCYIRFSQSKIICFWNFELSMNLITGSLSEFPCVACIKRGSFRGSLKNTFTEGSRMSKWYEMWWYLNKQKEKTRNKTSFPEWI